jgi:hypothetical protein
MKTLSNQEAYMAIMQATGKSKGWARILLACAKKARCKRVYELVETIAGLNTGVGAKAHQPGRHHAAELMDAAGLHPADPHQAWPQGQPLGLRDQQSWRRQGSDPLAENSQQQGNPGHWQQPRAPSQQGRERPGHQLSPILRAQSDFLQKYQSVYS